MLLFWASGRRDGWWVGEVVVDLAGDVALQTAHDVELGQALFGAPLDIGPGRWVAAHADQGDAPQGVVGSAVPAAVDSLGRLGCQVAWLTILLGVVRLAREIGRAHV